MGFMDLSTSVASKKHVDFSDARYQLAGKLQQNGKKSVRSTFTLYDDRETNKTAVQEISAAYALSDKRLPIGEILNKMVDFIIDMEDGVLNSEKDAIYAWKYSVALLNMYEDKTKRHGTLSSFDNGLKNAVINSQVFIKHYPGKYTHRTNFFDPKVKEGLVQDILTTFKDIALPSIHDSAIQRSHEIAENHNNPIMDRIVQWAVQNYGCKVDSFFEIQEDPNTHLFFSINTVVLHLKNGYDMSIIGYVGTDHDDRFAISILDANNIAITKHGERISKDELQDTLAEASTRDPIDPLTKLLDLEKKKNSVLKQQYDILSGIRPMIPANVLALQAAESVVGKDYIWGCKQFRSTHEDLPRDFRLEDVKLPQFVEEEEKIKYEQKKGLISDVGGFTNAIDAYGAIEPDVDHKDFNATMLNEQVEQSAEQKAQDAVEEIKSAQPCITEEEKPRDTEVVAPKTQPVVTEDMFKTTTADEFLKTIRPQEDLFDLNQPKQEKKEFGDPARSEFQMPMLTIDPGMQVQDLSGKNANKVFDTAATLLPGFAPIKKSDNDNSIPSVTKQAQPVPTFAEADPLWKDDPQPAPANVEEKPKKETQTAVKQPDLLLDDIDSLFS